MAVVKVKDLSVGQVANFNCGCMARCVGTQIARRTPRPVMAQHFDIIRKCEDDSDLNGECPFMKYELDAECGYAADSVVARIDDLAEALEAKFA